MYLLSIRLQRQMCIRDRCLGLRMGGEISTDTLEETAKTGIVNFNKMLEEKKKAGRSRRRSKEETAE